MNKEELVRNLEYTEKKHRNDIVNTFDTDISMMCSDVLRVLKKCIEIPDNATNGDVIRAMFPHAKIRINYYTYCVEVKLEYHSQYDKGLLFDKKWWNTIYKKARIIKEENL